MGKTLDWQDLMDRLGDEELITEIVPDFLSHDIDYVGNLKAAAGAGDVEMVIKHAHSLKGASASIGAVSLAEASRELEMQAKAGSIDNAELLIDQIQAELTALTELLSQSDWMDRAKLL